MKKVNYLKQGQHCYSPVHGYFSDELHTYIFSTPRIRVTIQLFVSPVFLDYFEREQ